MDRKSLDLKTSGRVGGSWDVAKPVVWYLVLGSLWILFSDRLLGLWIKDKELFVQLSVVKGWLFILVTSVLLFIWMSRSFGRLGMLVSFLNRVQKVAVLGYYVLDVKTGVWESSEVLRKVFGIDERYRTDIEGWLGLVHPGDREMMKNYFLIEVLEKRKSFDKEYRIVRYNDKMTRWVHGMGKLEYDSKGQIVRMIGTIQDITEKKKVEDDLRIKNEEILFQKQKLEAVLRDMGDGVFVMDKEGVIERVNRAAEKLIGISAKELLGHRCCEKIKLYSEKTGKRIGCLAEQVLKKQKVVELREPVVMEVGSKKIAVSGVGTPIRDVGGKLGGVVVVLRDETKQREINKLRADFVSLVSHQLRAPLTSIKWYTELLKEENGSQNNGENGKYVQVISESNQRLIELVDSLLAAGRAEGKSRESVTSQSVKSMLQEAEKLQGRSFMDKKIKLVGIEAVDESMVMMVDRSQMIQVLGNLLSNAGRYSPIGSQVEVKAEKVGEVVRVMVKDEGMGIPEKQKNKVFEKFFRADNVSDVPGSGLGLYLTKGIVERYGGKIWFESKEGKGTVFFVELPIKQKNERKEESDDSGG